MDVLSRQYLVHRGCMSIVIVKKLNNHYSSVLFYFYDNIGKIQGTTEMPVDRGQWK